MPYEFKAQAGYLQVRMYGKVITADIVGIADQLGQIESTAEIAPPRLIDFSEVEDTDVTFSEMNQVTGKRRAAKLKNDVKLAVVARNPFQFGVARMFQTLDHNPRIEIAIFPDQDAAVQWLVGPKGSGDHSA